MEIQVEGFRELDEKLAKLGEDVARRVMAAAMKGGGLPIRDEARRNAPVQRGILRRSITVRIHKTTSKAVEALIGVGKKVAFRAKFIEYGTAPHVITVQKAAPATLPRKGL